MAASRASSFHALKRLSVRSGQVRRLHITGPTTFPSPLLTTERPAVNLPRDIAGLRDECKKRSLPTVGSKQELVDRLSADELIQTRGFSTAVSADQKRPALSESDAFMALPPNPQPTRHFNTSRSMKAVNDSSTMDFAYFPDFNPDLEGPAPSIVVPIVPRGVASHNNAAATKQAREEVIVHYEISTASADGTHFSAPTALTGEEAATDDLNTLADKVTAGAKKLVPQMDESTSMIKTVWNGMLDDVFGPKSAKA